jgi:hypothetical protein
MHVGLNKVLSIEDQAPVPEPLTDSVQLKHFAREAEVNGRMELAARFYQEVTVLYDVASASMKTCGFDHDHWSSQAYSANQAFHALHDSRLQLLKLIRYNT